MFGNIYGLDLGTYEIKVFDKKQDKICRERDVIAIKNKKNIFEFHNYSICNFLHYNIINFIFK